MRLTAPRGLLIKTKIPSNRLTATTRTRKIVSIISTLNIQAEPQIRKRGRSQRDRPQPRSWQRTSLHPPAHAAAQLALRLAEAVGYQAWLAACAPSSTQDANTSE